MFRIYDKNKERIPFPDGVEPLDIFISSIDKERITDRLEGMDGVIDYGSTFNKRSIELELLISAKETRDYRLLRDAVYAMFQKTDTLYVSETYQRHRLYKVAVDEQFIPKRIPNNQRYADVKINCIMVDLPFAVTDDFSHTFETISFRLVNEGDVPIYPFQQRLKITISNVVGSTSFLELKNITNGSTFRVNEGVTNTQTIVINGAEVTSNGLQYLRKTNKGVIELDDGWNDFVITGATSAKIQFLFPYYYL